jgi:hypothetical protein
MGAVRKFAKTRYVSGWALKSPRDAHNKSPAARDRIDTPSRPGDRKNGQIGHPFGPHSANTKFIRRRVVPDGEVVKATK